MAASNAAILPDTVVEAAIEQELGAALSWAKRRRLPCTWLADERQISLVLTQPETDERFFLAGRFDGYRALPPSWQWYDADWAIADRLADSPKLAKPVYGSSMFIAKGARAIICAPFNRHAHAQYDGPHSDWGGLANWATAGGSHIRATTMGDMLQAVWRDFSHSRGRLG